MEKESRRCFSCGLPSGLGIKHRYGKFFCSVQCMNVYRQNKYVGNPWLWLIVGIVFCMAAFWALSARADHYGDAGTVLDGKILAKEGMCKVRGVPLTIPCEAYTDGKHNYLALWSQKKKYVLFVRKYNQDGSFENVYTNPNVQTIIKREFGIELEL